MIQRTQLKCVNCGSFVSRSNFLRHTASKSCKNGGKGKTRKEKYPWKDWELGNNLYRIPSGYIGDKISCRNKLNNEAATSLNPSGNFSSYHEEIQTGKKDVHNKGKEIPEHQKDKISKSLKKFRKDNPQSISEETRKILSEKKKQLYKDHPEKHPNYKLAGNRNKMNYPETVAHDWFEKNGIKAEHNQKIDRFYPDFTVGNVIIEIDGARWHSSPDQVARDQNRDAILKAAGYTIYRVSTKENIEQRLQEIFK